MANTPGYDRRHRPDALIQRTLATSISVRLRGTPCIFYDSDLRIETVALAFPLAELYDGIDLTPEPA